MAQPTAATKAAVEVEGDPAALERFAALFVTAAA